MTALYGEYSNDDAGRLANDVGAIARQKPHDLNNVLFLIDYLASEINKPLSRVSIDIWDGGTYEFFFSMFFPLEQTASYYVILLSEGLSLTTIVDIADSVWKEYCATTVAEEHSSTGVKQSGPTPFHEFLLTIENAKSSSEAKQIINKALSESTSKTYVTQIAAEALADILYRNREYRGKLVEDISSILYK